MKEELNDKLIKKYPKLFTDHDKGPTETLMCFGCDCGDGWYNLLDQLFGYITTLMERKLAVDYTEEYKKLHKGEENYYTEHCVYKFLPPQIILTQVKEKYGTLRVYHHSMFDDIPENIWANLDLKEFYRQMKEYDSKIEHAIDFAEYLSSITCDVTGGEGKLYTHGWYRVLSDEEAVKAGYALADAEKWVVENI